MEKEFGLGFGRQSWAFAWLCCFSLSLSGVAHREPARNSDLPLLVCVDGFYHVSASSSRLCLSDHEAGIRGRVPSTTVHDPSTTDPQLRLRKGLGNLSLRSSATTCQLRRWLRGDMTIPPLTLRLFGPVVYGRWPGLFESINADFGREGLRRTRLAQHADRRGKATGGILTG